MLSIVTLQLSIHETHAGFSASPSLQSGCMLAGFAPSILQWAGHSRQRSLHAPVLGSTNTHDSVAVVLAGQWLASAHLTSISRLSAVL